MCPTPNQRLEVSLLCVEYVVCDESLKNFSVLYT